MAEYRISLCNTVVAHRAVCFGRIVASDHEQTVLLPLGMPFRSSSGIDGKAISTESAYTATVDKGTHLGKTLFAPARRRVADLQRCR